MRFLIQRMIGLRSPVSRVQGRGSANSFKSVGANGTLMPMWNFKRTYVTVKNNRE